ncbi:oligosaccharide flippase family protein [Chryseobacterium proteolyticum]|uniref:oligosaccharide flippase family protein n=1 Tax=Chryseobacterium proteolyticum TaxID=118127 RepID=UPI003982FC66
MILLTNIGGDWYFQGMENQVYITVRYTLVRILTITLLFLFVKNDTDVIMYCFLLVLNFAGSNIFNLLFIFKSISLKAIRFSDLNIRRHFSPVLKVFIAAISINIYAQLDNFIIGFLAGDKYLAYYTVPNKLIRYVISFITVAGIVMLPKISRLWQTNKVEYYENLKLAFEIIFLLSVPFMGYFLIFSSFIIHIMAGQDFYESITTMRILSPLCVIVGLAYFFGYLLLYTQKRESVYTISVLISAVLSVFMNIIMVKYFQQNGAAVTQVIVELLAISFMAYKTRSQILKLKLSFKEISKVIFASSFACFSSILISKLFHESLIEFAILSVIYFFQIFIILIICKEKMY